MLQERTGTWPGKPPACGCPRPVPLGTGVAGREVPRAASRTSAGPGLARRPGRRAQGGLSEDVLSNCLIDFTYLRGSVSPERASRRFSFAQRCHGAEAGRTEARAGNQPSENLSRRVVLEPAWKSKSNSKFPFSITLIKSVESGFP